MSEVYAIIAVRREWAQEVLKMREPLPYSTRMETITYYYPSQVLFCEQSLQSAIETCRRLNREDSCGQLVMWRRLKVY